MKELRVKLVRIDISEEIEKRFLLANQQIQESVSNEETSTISNVVAIEPNGFLLANQQIQESVSNEETSTIADVAAIEPNTATDLVIKREPIDNDEISRLSSAKMNDLILNDVILDNCMADMNKIKSAMERLKRKIHTFENGMGMNMKLFNDKKALITSYINCKNQNRKEKLKTVLVSLAVSLTSTPFILPTS
jgi:hypothetical protein